MLSGAQSFHGIKNWGYSRKIPPCASSATYDIIRITFRSKGVVAQLVSALDSRSGGCGFEPRRPRQSERPSGLTRGVTVAQQILILLVGVRIPAGQPKDFQTRRCPSFFISHARAKKPNLQGVFEIRDVSKCCGGQARRGRFEGKKGQNHSRGVVDDTNEKPHFSTVIDCKYESKDCRPANPKSGFYYKSCRRVFYFTHRRGNLTKL